MEASFPFAALQVEKHFTLPVKITPPFRVFLVLEMLPGVIVNYFKPLKDNPFEPVS